MKYTTEQWAVELTKRKAWDWSKTDSELSRIHSVCRPCVQKLRIKLGLAPAMTKRIRVALAPHIGELGVVPTPTDRTQSGIYGWYNTVNKKWYIGQSIDIFARQGSHLRDLRLGRHFNTHLQDAFTTYGENVFEFRLLEEAAKESLDGLEIKWIAHAKSNNREYGYNFESGGQANKTISQETSKKIGDANRGKKSSDETRVRISAAKTGKPLTEKQRTQLAALHAGNKGRVYTAETLVKMSLANKGRHPSSAAMEGLRRWREENKGRPRPNFGRKISLETRIKMSIAAKARPHGNRLGHKATPETRLKLSLSHIGQKPWITGRQHSPESRQKMSESQKRRQARERQGEVVS